ncbi:MAG: GUN4 domain-containing protein, partial [Cyanobacteria bacterium P01_G01_bin.49]
ILKVIDERIKSINPEKEIADRVNLPVEMVRHYLDELTKQEYIEGAKSYPTDGTGDLAYTYLWLTNKGKFTLRNFDSLISKQASSRPEAKEKTESPTKDNLQEATIYGFAPESIGSNIVSGQTVQGNTFIGTQNNYGVMSPQSARDNSEDHVLQSLLEINRQSKKGINYIRLANLLAEKRWRQADQETKRIIDKLADQEGKSDLNEEDIKNIPIEDLGILDQLWSKFSNDHFGFRVQLQIWLEEGGKIDPEILKRFSERVGIVKNNRRLNYGDLDFNLKAPQGQFPLIWSVSSLEIVSGDLVSKNRLILLEHYNELLTSRFNKQTIKLRSERGVDYTKLEELLKEKKWIEADQETKKLMYKAIKQFDPWEKAMKTGQSIELVTPKEIDNFPCEDLQIIDELWVKYSNGRFGFSVQSQIYIDDLGGTKEYNQTLFLQFSDCVGWSRRGAFVNSTFQSKNVPKDAPRGHLPHLRQAKEFYVVSVPGQNEDWILKLLHRVKTCNL